MDGFSDNNDLISVECSNLVTEGREMVKAELNQFRWVKQFSVITFAIIKKVNECRWVKSCSTITCGNKTHR